VALEPQTLSATREAAAAIDSFPIKTMPIEVVILAIFFVLAAFYAAAEISMAALTRVKISELMEHHPSYAPLLERFKKNPSALLTTIIVSSNLVLIAFSSTATALSFRLSAEYGWNQIWASSVILTLSVMVVLAAEIAPKIIAKRHPEKVALLVLPGLNLSDILLGPFIRLLVGLIRWATTALGGQDVAEMPIVSEEELVRIVDEGAREGIIEKEESEMIQSIIEFGDTVVHEVMIPRTEMMGIPFDSSVEECLDIFIDAGYSRMPVYEEHFDQIKGIVYAKDFLAVLKERELIILQDVIRPAFFVPETKKVSDLLREFKKGKIHIAIVVDEYGGTAGLVTLEDLMEEIVGEIRDEYDLDAHPIRKINENLWEVDGSADLYRFGREFELDIPEERESATVGGFMAELFDKIPVKGEKLIYSGLEFEVAQATERRVDRLKVRRIRD
jgi:putative hemolysin